MFDADARRAYDLRYPSIKRSAGQTETSAPKAEQNTVPTAGPRTNGNSDPKSAPAAESRPASKPDHKTEENPSYRPNANSESKPDPKPDLKPEPKPDIKQDSRTKIKIDLKTIPKRRPVSHDPTAKKHTEDFKATLQQLRAKRASQKDDFLKARRILGGLQDEVARLSKEVDQATENHASIGKINIHRLSTRKIQEIEERKEQAQRTLFAKKAALRFKHDFLEEQEEIVRRREASYQLTESEIIRVKREIRKEREEEEKAKRRAEEEHNRQENDMEATRWGTDDQEATEVMRLWRRREEAEEEENRRHEEEIREARRRYKREAPRKRDIPKQNGCMYGGEWEMIQKPMRCGRCSMGTQRVAFWCPYCGRVSCEACLKFLMGERHDEIVVS